MLSAICRCDHDDHPGSGCEYEGRHPHHLLLAAAAPHHPRPHAALLARQGQAGGLQHHQVPPAFADHSADHPDWNDDCVLVRKKFRGISRQPAFCQAIYMAFRAQQQNLAAIVTAGKENSKGEFWIGTGQTKYLELSI